MNLEQYNYNKAGNVFEVVIGHIKHYELTEIHFEKHNKTNNQLIDKYKITIKYYGMDDDYYNLENF